MTFIPTSAEPLPRRLLRGALGGLAAGGVFIAVTMWFVTTLGAPAKAPLLLISTIVKGQGSLAAGTANPGLGLAVHLLLSASFGMAFALVAPWFKTNGTVAVAGSLYGGLLYLLNLLVLAPTVFTGFKMVNQPFELLVHLVFGSVLSLAFFGSDARRAERLLVLSQPPSHLP